jgi:integrase
VKKVLKRRDEQRNGEYVFHKGDGHPWASFYISNQFKEAVRARAKKITLETGSPCSLEDLHFHTLRHSFASVLVSNGIPLIKICQLLGHSSVVVTEIYAHLAPSSLQDTMSAFAHRGTAPPNQIERFIRKVDKLEVAEEE